ncbi:MAG: hypothetical protein KBA36_12315 [Thermomonas sp.]|nr:hypothetical protein [Thermomonas sp.]
MLVWPRQAHLSVTVRHPDGTALKIPLWMLEPAAAGIELREQVELSLPTWLALAALLEAQSVVLATVQEPRHADAPTDLPRSRRGGGGSAGDGSTRVQATAAYFTPSRTPISRDRGQRFTARRTPFHADRGQRFSVMADSGNARG